MEAYLNSALFWLTWLPATLFASLLVHTGFHRLVETKLKPIIKNPFSINKYATIREIAEAKIPDRDFPVGERSTNLLFSKPFVYVGRRLPTFSNSACRGL